MSFNAHPSGYFPGVDTEAVVSGETGVFIPYADLEGYNVASKNDIRQLIYGFLEGATNVYVDLASSDKSAKMSLRKTQSSPSTSVLRKTYTSVIDVSISGFDLEVVDESGV